MAVSGASFLKPLLSYLTIVSLREARECIVLINSKTLVDSPVASRRSLHSKNRLREERPLSSIDIFIESSCSVKLPAFKKSLSSLWNILNCYTKSPLYFPGFSVIPFLMLQLDLLDPAFRWSLFSMVCLISCFWLHHPSLNSLLSDAEELSVGDLTGTASTDAEAGFEILLGGCRIRIRTVKRVLTYHCRRKDMFVYVRMISREQHRKEPSDNHSMEI